MRFSCKLNYVRRKLRFYMKPTLEPKNDKTPDVNTSCNPVGQYLSNKKNVEMF